MAEANGWSWMAVCPPPKFLSSLSKVVFEILHGQGKIVLTMDRTIYGCFTPTDDVELPLLSVHETFLSENDATRFIFFSEGNSKLLDSENQGILNFQRKNGKFLYLIFNILNITLDFFIVLVKLLFLIFFALILVSVLCLVIALL